MFVLSVLDKNKTCMARENYVLQSYIYDALLKEQGSNSGHLDYHLILADYKTDRSVAVLSL